MKEILTDSNVPKRLWSDLKNKLAKEDGEVYEKTVHFKMEATNGKMKECKRLPALLNLYI